MEILKEHGLTYEDIIKLNEAAIKAADNCYAPYSHFEVGAAILSSSGRIITAGNVENASYGDTVCAERAAVFRFKAEGEKEIRCISVFIRAKNYSLYPTPCGMCRQVLAEFGYFPIICCKSPTAFIVKTVSSMLPYTFRYLETMPHMFTPDPKNLTEVVDCAEYWLQADPYTPTRQEVEKWLLYDDYASMRKYLCKRIDFGTAGLRGEMGAGYSRMNYVVVQQASQVVVLESLVRELQSTYYKPTGVKNARNVASL